MMMIHEPDFAAYDTLLQDHFVAGRWSRYLDMCANKDRASELLKIIKMKNGASRLWPLVNTVWSMSNNIAADEVIWDEIWQYAYRRSGELRRCRGIMRAADRRTFDNLSEHVTVYRGITHTATVEGYSWTLDYDVAELFARRGAMLGSGPAMIATMTVPRTCILAYFSERQESEIVINRHDFEWLDECEIIELELEQTAA